ncbi:MAG: type II toxin-antitoxin system HicA family toxin [Flavobacteriaceae bacterium]|jgi:predicted RNA binding protein YcfA (HicA-like mRNA interferase family)|nr:type II toxin-antitoxin system HicA family toxin [Flavobacteriaceae bacterium]
MKTSEATRKLKKAGCYFVEHGKEHDCWYSPITKKRFRVPRHQSQELATGTKNSIAKTAGVKL